MSETKILIGSLSNDLFRVANLTFRGSKAGATRFAQESKRWTIPLLKSEIPQHLLNIIKDVANSSTDIDIKTAEKYLMYGVLLQNYALHLK